MGPGPCVKCGHGGIAVAPLTVTRDRPPRVMIAAGAPPALLDPLGARDGAGTLEARICTACGHAEIYVRDPRRLAPVVRPG